MKVLASVLVALVLGACTQKESQVEAAASSAALLVRSLDVTHSRGRHLILLTAPNQCFTCSSVIGEIAALADSASLPLHYILSRKADRIESAQWQRARMPVDGALEGSAVLSDNSAFLPLFVLDSAGQILFVAPSRDAARLAQLQVELRKAM